MTTKVPQLDVNYVALISRAISLGCKEIEQRTEGVVGSRFKPGKKIGAFTCT